MQKTKKLKFIISTSHGNLPLRYFDENNKLTEPTQTDTYLLKNEFAKGYLKILPNKFGIGELIQTPYIGKYEILGEYNTIDKEIEEKLKNDMVSVITYDNKKYVINLSKELYQKNIISAVDIEKMVVYTESKYLPRAKLIVKKEEIPLLKRFSRKGNRLFEEYNKLLNIALNNNSFGLISTAEGEYKLKENSKLYFKIIELSKNNLYIYEFMRWMISCLELSEKNSVEFREKTVEVLKDEISN